MLIVKGQGATQQGVQNHPTAPDVHLRACVQPGRGNRRGSRTAWVLQVKSSPDFSLTMTTFSVKRTTGTTVLLFCTDSPSGDDLWSCIVWWAAACSQEFPVWHHVGQSCWSMTHHNLLLCDKNCGGYFSTWFQALLRSLSSSTCQDSKL